MGRDNNADLGDGPGQPPRTSRRGKNKSREPRGPDINRNHGRPRLGYSDTGCCWAARKGISLALTRKPYMVFNSN